MCNELITLIVIFSFFVLFVLYIVYLEYTNIKENNIIKQLYVNNDYNYFLIDSETIVNDFEPYSKYDFYIIIYSDKKLDESGLMSKLNSLSDNYKMVENKKTYSIIINFSCTLPKLETYSKDIYKSVMPIYKEFSDRLEAFQDVEAYSDKVKAKYNL